MVISPPSSPSRPVRPFQRGYDRAAARQDLIAGATVGVLLVPQALAYASLAGLPAVTGLYTALGALLLYAILGGSPYVSAGPSAVTALLVGATVASLADGDASRAVALASLMALMAGGVRLAMGLLRAGGLINVVSHPVLTGFTAGAGVIIAITQVPDLLGMQADRAGQVPAAVASLVSAAPTITPVAALVGLVCLVILVVGSRYLPAVPIPLVVVVGAALATGVGLLDPNVVPMVGEVPAGLPSLALPTTVLAEWRALLPVATVVALVGYVEGVSIAKSFALQDRQRIDPNRELIAHGAASVAAGLLGGFTNGGSFSRSALARSSGARTTGQSLVAMVIVIAALLLLPGVLALVPRAALAALVLYAVSGLFDVTAAREAMAIHRADAIGLILGFVAPMALGVDVGFLVAALGGLVVHLYRGTLPRITELGRLAGTEHYRNIQRWPEAITDPRVALLRLDSSLTFLNADAIGQVLRELVAQRESLAVVVLDLSGTARVDATGISVLRELLSQAEEGLLDLRLANVRGPVRDALIATGLWSVAESRVQPSIVEALSDPTLSDPTLAASPLLPDPADQAAAPEARPG